MVAVKVIITISRNHTTDALFREIRRAAKNKRDSFDSRARSMPLSVLSKFALTGRSSLVTGGSQGLGEAIAIALAEAGSDIAIAVDKNVAAAERVAQRVRELHRRALVVKANVAKKTEVEEVVRKVVEQFHMVDILVNNAGLNKWTPAEEMSEEVWDLVINVDLKGVFLCSQAVAHDMIRRKSGSIINISSIMGLVTQRVNRQGDAVPQAHYHSSKGGAIMLTRALALEWVKHNIRVNCISPGWFLTPAVERFFQENRDVYEADVVDRTPMKRPGNPSELGPLAVFLASEASSYITGQNFVIDGGYTIW